jgi:WD40 repeat protein
MLLRKKLWNSKGKLLKDWNILDIPSAFSINSLETWMFIGTNTGIVFGVSTKSDQNLIDAKSSALVYNSNDNVPITRLALSLNEQHLITGSKNGIVRIWDIPTQTCLNSVSFDGIFFRINSLAEIVGISSTVNPLMDPNSIPKLKLKKLDKYPISQEARGNLYLDAISVRDRHDYEESTENVDMDQTLLNLNQQNENLKILNAKLFKSALNALAEEKN